MTVPRNQMLDHITPVILTFNEEPNIKRTLSALDWAKRIIVVDSGSTDNTRAILAEDSRVSVFSRKFDLKVRLAWGMPLLSVLYCLFFKGLILDGRAGLFCSLQRLLVETAVALTVLEDRLRPR